uniref:MFS domain-containing protein n=1 Tax=Heterorhabditis bacteriophora TaxID=37862 RepID=A0A1I7WHK7_HETBA
MLEIAGMLFGVVMLKKLLKLRDTTIICLAIASMGISVLIIGLAQASWLIYASLLPGSLHGLLNPLTYTFMSYLVEPNEIGKAFAISSIAQKIAGFFQTVVLQNIYIATLNWYQPRRKYIYSKHLLPNCVKNNGLESIESKSTHQAGKNEEVSDFNTKNHKKAKMDFACGHMSWISEWTEVILPFFHMHVPFHYKLHFIQITFSDEKKFTLKVQTDLLPTGEI